MLVKNWPPSLFPSCLLTSWNRFRTVSFLILRLFSRLAKAHSIYAPANRECTWDVGLAPKAPPYPKRQLFIPDRKLPFISGATVLVRSARRQTKPHQWPPWVSLRRWNITIGQEIDVSTTGMACNPTPQLPDHYCHKTPKTPTPKWTTSRSFVESIFKCRLSLWRTRFLPITPLSPVHSQPHEFNIYSCESHGLSSKVLHKMSSLK